MKRYCHMCETVTYRRECKACGMDTEKVPAEPDVEREHCPRCDGDGFGSMGGNCPACHGSGKVAQA